MVSTVVSKADPYKFFEPKIVQNRFEACYPFPRNSESAILYISIKHFENILSAIANIWHSKEFHVKVKVLQSNQAAVKSIKTYTR